MKKKLRLIDVNCPLCGSKKNYSVLYRRNFSEADFNKEVYSARRLPDRIHYQIVKCLQDGLIRSTPILEPVDLNKLYQESLFTYEEEISSLGKSYLAVLDKVLPNLNKDSNILEVGCGNGFMLEKLFESGYKNIFGVELSIDAAKKADEKIRKRIYLQSVYRARLKNDFFDLIFLFQTFDHLASPNLFLKKCRQLLKRGGYILTLNHNIDSLQARILGEKSPIIDIEHTFFYSSKTARLAFENNGFKVIESFSPKRLISLKSLFRLLPIPSLVKESIVDSKNKILDQSLNIRLGNLCLIARK